MPKGKTTVLRISQYWPFNTTVENGQPVCNWYQQYSCCWMDGPDPPSFIFSYIQRHLSMCLCGDALFRSAAPGPQRGTETLWLTALDLVPSSPAMAIFPAHTTNLTWVGLPPLCDSALDLPRNGLCNTPFNGTGAHKGVPSWKSGLGLCEYTNRCAQLVRAV